MGFRRTGRPNAVVISASEMPAEMAESQPEPVTAMAPKALMIPKVVRSGGGAPRRTTPRARYRGSRVSRRQVLAWSSPCEASHRLVEDVAHSGSPWRVASSELFATPSVFLLDETPGHKWRFRDGIPAMRPALDAAAPPYLVAPIRLRFCLRRESRAPGRCRMDRTRADRHELVVRHTCRASTPVLSSLRYSVLLRSRTSTAAPAFGLGVTLR